MLVSEFDFTLPEELIAQEAGERGAARMLVVDRATGKLEDRMFGDLPGYLRPGDCLALNNTRVFPARLLGYREGFTGQVEVLMIRAISDSTWLCLVHPGRKIRTGERLVFGERLRAGVLGRNEFGQRTIRFECEGDLWTEIERVGHVPLPPYIERGDTAADRERYQTVFAAHRGSVAAPTAGLHFTPEILEECRRAGADVTYLTLHVGLGTFAPLRAERIEDVKLHEEHFELNGEDAARLANAQRRIAVGTTAVRTLETVMRRHVLAGETDLFISPGFEFKAVDAMLTNFHLPKSSLFVLVCALAGRELMLHAYQHAIEAKYRFYSYGDCMFIY
jgi:S-adenosylmethionine:tRNA ribosyltransferase-isomerase